MIRRSPFLTNTVTVRAQSSFQTRVSNFVIRSTQGEAPPEQAGKRRQPTMPKKTPRPSTPIHTQEVMKFRVLTNVNKGGMRTPQKCPSPSGHHKNGRERFLLWQSREEIHSKHTETKCHAKALYPLLSGEARVNALKNPGNQCPSTLFPEPRPSKPVFHSSKEAPPCTL